MLTQLVDKNQCINLNMKSFDLTQITEKILLSCKYLDEEKYLQFLNVFTEEGKYEVVSQVPETKSKNTWVNLTKTELQNLLTNAHRHHWDTGKRFHVIGPPLVMSESLSSSKSVA